MSEPREGPHSMQKQEQISFGDTAVGWGGVDDNIIMTGRTVLKPLQ